jgi:hypothetical protein
VLFIDEIHRIARPAEELLYMAMEDFRVDVIVGKGPGATAIPLDLAPFTLVGATTRAGLLTGPLRDRFGFTGHMDFYAMAELEQVLNRSAELLGVDVRPDGAAEIASRSRGTPRIANRLLRRVRDYAEVRADGVVTEDIARAALAVYDVDELGLDRLDRAVLSALTRGRAVPRPRRPARPHAARPDRHPGRLAAPRAGRACAGAGTDAVRRVGSVLDKSATVAGNVRCEQPHHVDHLHRRRHRAARVLGPCAAPPGPGSARTGGTDRHRHRGDDDVRAVRHGGGPQRGRDRHAVRRSRYRGQVGDGRAARPRVPSDAVPHRAGTGRGPGVRGALKSIKTASVILSCGLRHPRL